MNKRIFPAVFLAVSISPFLMLPFYSGMSRENRDLESFPELIKEEAVNLDFFSEMGDWFQEHFAFRNELVTADSLVLSQVGGISSSESVILGQEGWLYYESELADYQRTEPMTDRALYDLAHSLSMTQSYLQEQGIDFLFVIAPNKSSIYGEYMPWHLSVQTDEASNYDRLLPYLQEEGVHSTDLKSVLLQQKEGSETGLYRKEDSHWNNQGAAIAADQILSALSADHTDYSQQAGQETSSEMGDLAVMLYPSLDRGETDVDFGIEESFTVLNEIDSYFDPEIWTLSNTSTQGSLVMFRDSFTNALLPFLSEAYAVGCYSRSIPFRLSITEELYADTVIIEAAERFLADRAYEPAAMPAQAVIPVPGEYAASVQEVTQETYDDMVCVSGKISDALTAGTRIFVQAQGELQYEAFPVCYDSGEEGFIFYLPNLGIDYTETLQVYLVPQIAE